MYVYRTQHTLVFWLTRLIWYDSRKFEKERGGVDYRLDTYSEVYKRLTGKGVNFEFPQSATDYSS